MCHVCLYNPLSHTNTNPQLLLTMIGNFFRFGLEIYFFTLHIFYLCQYWGWLVYRCKDLSEDHKMQIPKYPHSPEALPLTQL